jgi:glucokinase
MTQAPLGAPRLVGDIGGTHARFGVATADGGLRSVRSIETRAHASLQQALQDYLGTLGEEAPLSACLAVAAPVVGDEVVFTNCAWRFSLSQLQADMRFDSLVVINDFEAIAHALPALHNEDLLRIGGETGDDAAPKVVIGPGTGCGVAVVVPAAEGSCVIATQGGHASIGASNAAESRLLGDLLRHAKICYRVADWKRFIAACAGTPAQALHHWPHRRSPIAH